MNRLGCRWAQRNGRFWGFLPAHARQIAVQNLRKKSGLRCSLRPAPIPRRWRRRAHARALRLWRIQRRAGIDDLAVVEHIGVVGDLEAHAAHVLLDQQHGNSLARIVDDDAEDFADDQRRQALGWLVEQQAASGLSSSARAIASISCSPPESCRPRLDLRSREPREQLVDARDRPRPGALQRHLEIFLDASDWRRCAGLPAHSRRRARRCGTAASRWWHGRRCVTAPFARWRQAHEAAQRRGLAGAVAAEQRDDLRLRAPRGRRRAGYGSCRNRCGGLPPQRQTVACAHAAAFPR